MLGVLDALVRLCVGLASLSAPCCLLLIKVIYSQVLMLDGT